MNHKITKKLKGVIIILAIFIFFGGVFAIDYFSSKDGKKSFLTNIIDNIVPSIPEAIGGNFDFNYKKLPFNAGFIDITFSTDLDDSTINRDNISLYPEIDGTLKLIDNNTIRYEFTEELNPGQNINITLSDKIKDKSGKNIKQDYEYDIEIVGNAEVTRLFPEGDQDNLSQNLIAFFNMPVVPLSSLDERDKLPCPFEITPNLPGKCKWTTTSVVEYIPDNHLEGATKYEVKIVDKEGLFYKIEGKEVSISTTPLRPYVNYNFSPLDGINLTFNFEIEDKDLANFLELRLGGSKPIKSENILEQKNNSLPIKIEKVKDSKSSYKISLKEGNFNYSTNYELTVKKGISPKKGNIPLVNNDSRNLRTYDFLTSIESFREIYSSTGVLIDTQKYYITNLYNETNSETNSLTNSLNNNNNYYYLPNKGIFFNLNFSEEVLLDKSKFQLIDEAGKEVKTKISYIKEEKYEEDENGKINKDKKIIVDNKKRIKLEIEDDLKTATKYTLKIDKSINKALEKDIIKIYESAPDLTVKRYKFISYRKSCIYISNPIDNLWEKKDEIMDISPEAGISSIYDNDWLPWDVEEKYKDSKGHRRPLTEEEYYKEGYCAPARSGENLIIASTKLNPNSKYTIGLKKGLEDIYGNKYSGDWSEGVTTDKINPEDMYLYSSLNKYLNLIPRNLDIVLNLQTINLDQVNIEACQASIYDYIGYIGDNKRQGLLKKTANIPLSCTNEVYKTLNIQNKNWEVSVNKFDLATDIFGSEVSSDIVKINGSKLSGKGDFENIYFRSDISLVLEKSENKNLIFATDMSGQPLENLSFGFYKFDDPSSPGSKNYNNYKYYDIEKSVQYKKDGVYEIPFEIDNIRFIIARDGESVGLLDLDRDFHSNYDFGYIAGESTAQKDYLYLYTDRPLYKPGDTVYFKGLLRQFKFTGYEKSGIKTGKLTIKDNNYSVVKEVDIKVDDNSNFNGEILIPSDAPLGRFIFEFTSGDNWIPNNGHFFIEEYTKPVFKVDTDLGDKKDYILGDKVNIKVSPSYYFGGKMINTNGRYSVMTQNYYFDAKDYSGYQFGEGYRYFDCIYWGYCDYDDNSSVGEEFEIDESGEYTIDYRFPEVDKTGEKIYSLNIEITDPDTQKTVNKTESVVLHATDGYVGMMSKYWNSKDKGIDLSGVVIDHLANPLINKEVVITLTKKEWKSVKKMGVDGIFYNDYSLEETLENTEKIKSNEKGEFSINLKTKDEGEYEIRVSYTGKNKKSFESSRTVYVSGNDYVEWRGGNNDLTELVSDKVILNAGEKAEYLLKSPVDNGKALIVIEKDDGILDYFVHDIKSYGDKITFEVKNNYYPNFYIKAYLIGKEKDNPLPIYKRALAVTKVYTDDKELQIKVTPESAHYLPGGIVKLEVQVTDKEGKAVENANGSIAIVDESLLALKGNPKKNPFAFFYDMKRYLGVVTYSSLKNLIEKLEVKDISNGEKGGAGDQVKGGDSKKKRGEFKDTAYWLANFTTDKNGKVTITTPELPDNLTTWVVEVVASTPANNKIGVGETTFITSKKLMINDNLPSFFGSRDKIILSPVVFNKTGENSQIDVTISGTNITAKDSTKKILLKDGEQQTVNFEIEITDIGINYDKNTFFSKINLKAVSKETGEVDEVEKFVQIKEVSTPESTTTFGKTSDVSYDERIEVGDIMENAGTLKVNYSPTLLSALIDSVDYLNRYPYGSSEQKTSAIMPNIYIKKLYNSADLEFDLKTKMIDYWAGEDDGYQEISLQDTIENYLVEIKKYQKKDGGFVYWYDSRSQNNYSDFHLSTYIVSSLSEIRDTGGFKPDEKMMKDSVNYLKTRFYKNFREGCSMYDYYGNYDEDRCKYSYSDKLRSIEAILDYDNSDYEAYKMWKVLEEELKKQKEGEKDTYSKYYSYSTGLARVGVVTKLSKVKDIPEEEKKALEKEVIDYVENILKQELVFNPKGAYLGRDTYYSRLLNTASLIQVISDLGIDKFEDLNSIIDNMNRWIVGQKADDTFGSTQDNIKVIKAMTSYLEASGELKDVNYLAKLKINSEIFDEKKVDDKNKLEVFTKTTRLTNLQESNTFNIEKQGKGNVYYDLNLKYYKDIKDISARDEGLAVERYYYDYDEYKKLEAIKQEEWQKYRSGEISYEELKYPKPIAEYMNPIKEGKVGELVMVYNKIISTETRDQVAFEGYIPAGAELVNPNLATSTVISASDLSNREYSDEATNSKNNYNNYSYGLFEKEEYRYDRYFGYTEVMYPGIHSFTYMMRFTHAGTYSIRPSLAFEFYNVEVFGRTDGVEFEVR